MTESILADIIIEARTQRKNQKNFKRTKAGKTVGSNPEDLLIAYANHKHDSANQRATNMEERRKTFIPELINKIEARHDLVEDKEAIQKIVDSIGFDEDDFEVYAESDLYGDVLFCARNRISGKD